eukprot:scaffold246602_cov31-Tisochrysis_lutea.AAC.1
MSQEAIRTPPKPAGSETRDVAPMIDLHLPSLCVRPLHPWCEVPESAQGSERVAESREEPATPSLIHEGRQGARVKPAQAASAQA